MVKFAYRSSGMTVFMLICGMLSLVSGGCGSTATDDEGRHVLSADEAKVSLEQLTYHYEFEDVKLPRGATEAFRVKVHGPHHTTFDLGVALGVRPHAVPVAHAGTSDISGIPEAGVVFTDNIVIEKGPLEFEAGKQFHTKAQWHEASHMLTEMEEQICKKAIGHSCPAV